MFRKCFISFSAVLISLVFLAGTPSAQPTEPAAAEATDSAAEATKQEQPADATQESPKDGAQADAKGATKETNAKGAAAQGDGYEFTDLDDSFWLAAKATGKTTEHVDWMFYAILGLSIFCFVAITIAVVYLTVRYRHRQGHRSEPSRAHDNVLEVTWTIIPSIICVLIFIGGWRGYLSMSTAPGNAMEVQVTGLKWRWLFNYRYGNETVPNQDVLHVPVNTPVKLIMRSEDVLHSFYVPAFRLKQDVIPSRYSYLWFEADKPGVYRVYCAEYCGDSHWDMKTKVVVHESGGYEKWLAAKYEELQVDCREEPEDKRSACYQEQGQRIYEGLGCKQCHSTDGASGTGPTFQGIWGASRSFTDGTSGTVDENYIRESVLEPMAKVRSGFNPVMPTFQGKLKDKDIDALINWMKTL